MTERLFSYSKYLILLGLIAFPLFWQLDELPLRIYDEARAAINAQEMLQNSDWLEPHFNGNPDMWATKPPLLIWCQSALMKIIGQNEWAVRLPSAIAAFLTCLLLFVFSTRYLKRTWLGAISALVLITINGYVTTHGTRTGDYDAMLTLFTTLSGLSFFLYVELKGNKYLRLFFLFLTLAVLTKGVAGLLFLPALAIYAMVQKRLRNALLNPDLYIGIGAFLSIAIGYYLLREYISPGYLETISENELGGRFLETQEQHGESFWFYYRELTNNLLKPWVVWTFAGMFIGILSSNARIRRLAAFSTLMIAVFSIVISFAQTKLIWYPIPMYPFMAILAGITVFKIFRVLKGSVKINQVLKWNMLPFLFLFTVFYHPYRWTVNDVIHSKEKPWDIELYSMANYLRSPEVAAHGLDGCFVVVSGYDAQNIFYLNALNSLGVEVEKKDKRKLEVGDKILVNQSELVEFLEENYTLKKIEEIMGVVKYQVLARTEQL